LKNFIKIQQEFEKKLETKNRKQNGVRIDQRPEKGVSGMDAKT